MLIASKLAKKTCHNGSTVTILYREYDELDLSMDKKTYRLEICWIYPWIKKHTGLRYAGFIHG